MRTRAMWAKALLARMEAAGGVAVADAVADVAMAVKVRRPRKLRRRKYCRRWRRLSSHGTKIVRPARIVDRVKTVADGMIAETAAAGTASLLVRIVKARNASRMGLSRSRLFFRVNRFQSIGVEMTIRRSRRLPSPHL